MSKLYRLVVFDWEGTLGDTLGQILKTVETEAKRLKFGELDEHKARQHVSLGLVKAVKLIFPHLSIYQHGQLLEAVQSSMVSNSHEIYLMPGAKEIIQQIRQAGMELAIATNKGQQSLQRALEACKLDTYFTTTRSAGQVPPKPCPQMLQEILEACGATPSETLMIGDSVSDIEMATQIGVDAVGVDFYHQQSANLKDAGAIDVFDDYQQLAKFLRILE